MTFDTFVWVMPPYDAAVVSLPKIIQGGMGAGVSSWRLARAVSSLGQLGVVSGIALDVIMTRRLQDGDPDGDVRRALDHFPLRDAARRIIDKYFVADGKPEERPYAAVKMHSDAESRELAELCMAGNFVEVFLAREGHDNPVGINYLEKIQLPHLPSIYGAMLAGAAVVLMGAGIPTKIPGVLDRLSTHEPASYEISVTGAEAGETTTIDFNPRDFFTNGDAPVLTRPKFVSIISSNVLAATMLRRSNGRVDGFIVETPTAGGHNAPPRGKLQLDGKGQPLYGEKDAVDLEKLRELGVPFWLAGGYGSFEGLCEALSRGAAGVQVGTAFAFCEESGLKTDFRRTLLENSSQGRAGVFTDPDASPTGFPFKVATLVGSLSQDTVYEERERVCDLGFLREAYKSKDGRIGFRCPAEPVNTWVAKGGAVEDTRGRKCLCNALLANIGHPQLRKNSVVEPPMITAGDDLETIARFIAPGKTTYSVRDVVEQILGEAVES